jgi:hypothetical protein
VASDDYMGLLEEDTKAKIAALVAGNGQGSKLLRRGLGGLSNEELMESKMPFAKREPHHATAKVSRIEVQGKG